MNKGAGHLAGPESTVLSPRQREVLQRLVEHGGTNKQIARAMGITASTVKNHLDFAFRKLGATTRVQAVLAFQRLLGN